MNFYAWEKNYEIINNKNIDLLEDLKMLQEPHKILVYYQLTKDFYELPEII